MGKIRISKLGMKFIFGTLLPSLLILVMFGVGCVVVMTQNKKESVKHGIQEQAGINDKDINESLTAYKDALRFEEGYTVMYNYINNSDNEKEEYYCSKVSGLLTEYISYDSDNLVAAFLADFRKSLYVTDSISGRGVFAPTGPFISQTWYDEASIAKGDVYVSDIYETRLSNKYSNNKVVCIVCPVRDWKTNELMGAYGIEVTMNCLNSYIRLDGYKDTIAMVVDGDGNVKYCKNAVLKNTRDELTHISHNINQYHLSMVDYSSRKYNVYETNFGTTGWKVTYLVNKEEIDAQVYSSTYSVIAIMIIAGILLCVVMVRHIVNVVRKINAVREHTIGIANGVYDVRMAIESDDELGELFRAFNRAVDYLKFSAEHDDVTEIYNISTFYVKAQEMIEREESEDKNIRHSIIRLDIDHFRVVNDIYNWQVGDNVLRHIAGCIKGNLNEGSICGRMTGDMFVMCIRHSTLEELEDMLNRIKKEIMEYDIVIDLIPHFGIYLDAEKDLPVYLMCDRAGIALSLIKGNMLTTLSYYDTAVNRKNMDIKFIETSTQAAFEERQFYIQLQPKYNMHTNEIVGAEALVRWKHPVKGIIRPDVFIPVFEKNGNILKLDEYVWEETCRCISRWQRMGYKSVPVSVNISRIHIYNKHLVQKLCDLVEKYDIPIELLQLEFTESALLEDASELYELMDKLKEKNFVLLMDDFASGYSSLNTLKSAPFDIVKLDKEFISAVADSKRDRLLVQSTISMLDMQEMEIVVEGVETEEQVDILVEAGCNVAQGFYYSRPIDVSDFESRVYGEAAAR